MRTLSLKNEIFMRLIELASDNPERVKNIPGKPFGHVYYAESILQYQGVKNDQPDCWFQFVSKEQECPWLMEFKSELSEEFKLPILTQEESKVRSHLLSIGERN